MPSYLTKKSRLKARLSTPEFEPRAVAEIDLGVLSSNYDAILDQVPSQFVLPMVKANAYGHGARQAVRALHRKESLFGFGVASLEEGLEVREELGMPRPNRPQRVLVFSGTAPWSDAKGGFCEEHALTPVIASDEDWKSFVRGGWPSKLTYHLKFNTGMNRLGMSPSGVNLVLNALRKAPHEEWPEGVCTHLAMSEKPSDTLTQLQMDRFREIRKNFESLRGQRILFHFANSGAIWNSKALKTEDLGDIVRPGLSLYGVPPWKDAPLRRIAPAMQLSYTIALKRELKSGEKVGYGGTYQAKGSQWIATLTAGYADGVLRALAGKGDLWVRGKRRRLAGRVSMDLITIECDASTAVGEKAYLLGQGIDPWTQAEAAGTIPYELMTSVSSRVKRIYVENK